MNAITKHYIDGTFVECIPEYYPKHRKPEMFQPGSGQNSHLGAGTALRRVVAPGVAR
jgi:hypothetical protein